MIRSTDNIARRTKRKRHTSRVKMPHASRRSSSRWALPGLPVVCNEISRNHAKSREITRQNRQISSSFLVRSLSPCLNTTALSGACLVLLAIHAQQRKRANPSSQDHTLTHHGSLGWGVHSSDTDVMSQAAHAVYLKKRTPAPERHKNPSYLWRCSGIFRNSAKILKMNMKNPKIPQPLTLSNTNRANFSDLSQNRESEKMPRLFSVPLPLCITTIDTTRTWYHTTAVHLSPLLVLLLTML